MKQKLGNLTIANSRFWKTITIMTTLNDFVQYLQNEREFLMSSLNGQKITQLFTSGFYKNKRSEHKIDENGKFWKAIRK